MLHPSCVHQKILPSSEHFPKLKFHIENFVEVERFQFKAKHEGGVCDLFAFHTQHVPKIG